MKLPKEENIPERIVEKDRWILWKEEKRDGKLTKIPCAPWKTEHWGSASATDPDNWTSFDNAKKYAKEREGYGTGFVFSKDDDVVGIDLDNCIKNGEIKGFAGKIIKKANSYTELSPSGKGVHILIQGKLSKAIKPEEEDIEIYGCDRFFTVTGKSLKKTPSFLREEQDLLNEVEEKFEKTIDYEPKGEGVDIDILDVVPTDNLEKKGKQLQGSHPVHGSKTGMNFTVDPSANQWFCHHSGHNCGGGPFEWIAVEEEIIDCGSWDRGKGPLRGKKWSKVVKAAYDRDLITADQAQTFTKQAEDEVVPFEDKLDEAIEDFMQKENTINIHPVIDFREDLGLCMGTSLPSIGDGEGKAIVSEDFLFGGASKMDQLIGELPNKELVARDVDFTLANESTISKVMQLVVEIKREGQIRNEVDCGDVFEEVYEKVKYYWYHPDERWLLALTCWIVGTYFFPLFEACPIWRAQGERETGKSTSLKVINILAWNPTDLQTNLRPAPLYRTVEGSRPTYLADVTDISKQQMSDLVDVCESGFERGGSVPRCIGDANKPVRFSTYCPKAIASRRDLPFDAKSIRVFTEAPRNSKERMKYTERWVKIRTDPEVDEITLNLMRLALTKWNDVLDSYMNLNQSEDLMGRRFTIWRPLLAVCRTFSPDREDKLRGLAVENAEKEEATDFTYDVENAVLGFLLKDIPSGVESYSVNLTGGESLTEGVRDIMGQDVNVPWQTVRSATENLKIIKGRFNTESGKKYRIDVNKAEERIDSRNITKEGEEPIEVDEDVYNELERDLDKDDEDSEKNKVLSKIKFEAQTADEIAEELDLNSDRAKSILENLFEEDKVKKKAVMGEEKSIYAPVEESS